MKTAFIIFDDLTALDFVGVYDPLTRLKSMGIMPDFEWRICSLADNVSDGKSLRFQADCVREPLAKYDLLVVPGGYGTRSLQHDAAFIEWLRTAAPVPLKASVCTGALLLGAAGFLQGKPATTHPNALDQLKPYYARVVAERVVDAGDVVTARGVTSAIDLGLYLVRRLAGPEAEARVAKQMDYPHVWCPVELQGLPPRSNS
jgi:transcriptional regulator GlxA family with amidase domain